jgi:hypothetical protein
VEIGQTKTRISKASAQFFLDWVQERAHRVQLVDTIQKAEVLKDHEMARAFWEQRLTQANAE